MVFYAKAVYTKFTKKIYALKPRFYLSINLDLPATELEPTTNKLKNEHVIISPN